MDELLFSPDEPLPELDPASPAVEAWLENDGSLCALTLTSGDHHWMKVLTVGTYRFGADGPALAVPDPGVPREVVLDAYYRMVLPTALQARGSGVLHASAVRTRVGVVALCARSETGKSTIAYGLHERGHELYADDAVVFDLDGNRARVRRVPFAVRLREASAEHFGRAPKEQVLVTGGAPTAAETPLAALYVLGRFAEEHAGPVVELTRLPPAAAFAELLPHAYGMGLRDEARKARLVRHYLGLANAVPVFQVRFRSGLENLPAILEAIERSAGVSTG